MKKEKFVQAYLNTRPLPLENIVEARKLEQSRASMSSRVHFPGTIDNVEITTDAGRSKVRIYTPDGHGPFPVIIYMHGGGFSIGSPDTCDNLCRAIAMSAGAVLISIDYRLAPEHKFPTALEECYRLARWSTDNDVALNIRNDQLVVAGDSAGGNLAAAICLLNQTRQELDIRCQVLICPMLDQQTPFEHKISKLNDPLLTAENSQTFSRFYFTSPAEARSPLASPLLASQYAGLPPAIIVTAELDPLSDEAHQYVRKLRKAGIMVTHHHYQGQVHDFPLFIKSLDDARDSAEKIGLELADLFQQSR